MTSDTTLEQDADREQTAKRPTIVKNAASSYFTAVDLESGQVLEEVGSGQYPHTVLFHPDLPVAYLLYITSAHLEVLDLESLETIQRVEKVGTTPIGSALGSNAEYLFVGTAIDLPGTDDPGVLTLSIDDDDGTVEHAGQRTSSRCSGMRVGPDGDLYVAQKREQEVLALSADDELAVRDRVPTGEEPHDMYVLAEDGLLVVNNSGESSATFIDPESGTVRAEAETGQNPHGFAVADGPDYRYGLFPARDEERFAVVDLDAAAAGAETPTEALLNVGTTTGFADTTPDRRYAVIDSYDDPFVTILDLTDLTIEGQVEVGGEPLHVVFSEDGEECYIGNMERNELAVLDTAPLADDRPENVTVARRIRGLGEKPSGIFRPEESS
jgi:DNA-binding beta-propeller fold protein YncE